MLRALLQPDGLHRGEDLRSERRSDCGKVGFSGPDAEDRKEIERFIFGSFSQNYGAHVHHFLPQLMSLRGEDGKLLAACGLRIAGTGPLFLEAYLGEPIEKVISGKAGRMVDREHIVEIGNLAGFQPGIARMLIAVLVEHLHGMGMKWAVFTANQAVRNVFARLNMELIPLCIADRTKLPAQCQAGWGSYYSKRPHVMAGNVAEGGPELIERRVR